MYGLASRIPSSIIRKTHNGDTHFYNKRYFSSTCMVVDQLIDAIEQKGFNMSNEVENAVKNNRPIVALESTIISHGMPYPKNYKTAIEVENIVRENNAVPATVAILNGEVHIGLNETQLELLATEGTKGKVKKCSRRDISYVVSKKEHGATTVAGTLAIANAFGLIDIFVTGGIGGVHRGDDLDISADLVELGRNNNIMVVCAGVKSILDIPRTLEYLETQGVAVIGYNTDEFPSFFTRKSGLSVPMRLNTIDECSNWILTNKSLNLNSGSILAVPNSEPFQDEAFIDQSVNQALNELEDLKLNNPTFTGKEATPFLLKRVNELTGGNSLKSNIALVKNNAHIGSKIAAATARTLSRNYCTAASNRRNEQNRKQNLPVYIFGGSTVDLVGTPVIQNAKLANTSTPGIVRTSYGGVGRNIAEALGRCFKNGNKPDHLTDNHCNIKFVSFVGDDTYGVAILEQLSKLEIDITDVHVTSECSTATYQAILDSSGDLYVAIADMQIMDMMNMRNIDSIFNSSSDSNGAEKYPKPFINTATKPYLVIIDGNLPNDVFQHICKRWNDLSVPIWFEPTSIEKAKLASVENIKFMNFISPNLMELKMIYNEVKCISQCNHNHDQDGANLTIEDMALCVLKQMQNHAYLVITLGEEGVCLATLKESEELVNDKRLDEVEIKYLKPDVIDMDMVNATGAGDTLVGATVYYLLMQSISNDSDIGTMVDTLTTKDLCKSLNFGMKAAGLSIQCAAPISTKLDDLHHWAVDTEK
jgi:pseudouridylate synthase / pseudouridine kinase